MSKEIINFDVKKLKGKKMLTEKDYEEIEEFSDSNCFGSFDANSKVCMGSGSDDGCPVRNLCLNLVGIRLTGTVNERLKESAVKQTALFRNVAKPIFEGMLSRLAKGKKKGKVSVNTLALKLVTHLEKKEITVTEDVTQIEKYIINWFEFMLDDFENLKVVEEKGKTKLQVN